MVKSFPGIVVGCLSPYPQVVLTVVVVVVVVVTVRINKIQKRWKHGGILTRLQQQSRDYQ